MNTWPHFRFYLALVLLLLLGLAVRAQVRPVPGTTRPVPEQPALRGGGQ